MKTLLIFGIIGCVCAGMFTGCTSSGAEKITPSNPLIIDASPETESVTPPAVTPEPEPAYTPPPVTPEPEPEPSISFQILNLDQDYYEILDMWDVYVTFDYEVRNTGSVDIDYYEVAFIAECAGGKEFHDWANGSDLAAGAARTKEELIDVGGLEVIDIIVNEWGFDAYSVSHEEIEPELELSASFRIDDWEQPYYDSLDEYGIVEIFYEVENTGDLDIDYYEVYFTVECSGGKEYTDWTNGTNVKVGRTYSGSKMIDVGDREARDVDIDDWDLTHY